MTTTLNNETLIQSIHSLLDKGHHKNEIEHNLVATGYEPISVREKLHELIKMRAEKKRLQGLTFIAIGAIICLLSFGLTITSSFAQDYFHLVLIGLTSVGILLVFAGLVMIF